MLQALITGADCLLCEQCLSIGSSHCSGIFKQCSPDVTHCIKGLENNTVVPAVDKTPNGYKCEDCFTTETVDPCAGAGEVQCTGELNTCTSFSGTATRPGEDVKQYTAKGCASQDFCHSFYLAGSHAYTYDLQCSPAEKL
uniref:Sodefrin-like factor 7 n=1 Tax=Lissotriton helveticus TaxID=256425 RepID=A0A0B5H3N1_9SALA|nr:sodefrin precursor-like factor 7 [Lissotriton helveticus]